MDVDDVVEDLFTDSDSSTDSSDDSDEDDVNPVWSPTQAVGFRNIPFTGNPGLLVPIPGNNKPIDWFFLLLDIVFLERIVVETNRYAVELLCSPNTNLKSRITYWKDVTISEFKTFLGLLLHTGTIRLNRLNDYWKTHHLMKQTIFSQYMSRDRFLLILRCLHFSKPNTVQNPEPTNDRSFKIKLIVDYFNDKMKQIYYPDRELTIDEEMVLWRGRLAFRQYIKGKRHKYGIKIYSLNEPEGLLLRFHVYTGKNDPCSGKGHTVKIVMHLLRDFLGKGHSVFMDNYYNSFVLSSILLRHDTYSTGTLRSNRKHCPPAVTSKHLAKGQTIANFAESVMIGKWKDKRVVNYISTQHENDMVTMTNHRGREKTIPKPIVHYNAHMKGVDRLDQMMAYYPSERKTVRWHKKIFIHFLQAIMVNSYYLYNKYTIGEKLNLYDFRFSVLESLLPPQELPQPRVPVLTPPRTHKISQYDKRQANGDRCRKRCRSCSKEGKTKYTTYECKDCPGQPGLCAIRCFDKHHSEIN